MSASLPEYYFRIRDNGALVFRIEDNARNRRLEMDPIAVVNLRKQEIKPQGDRTLSDADETAIRAWIKERLTLEAAREVDDLLRCVDTLNLTAHWVQSRATDAQLDQVTDPLLMAMHDLRSVLVRKKAERLTSET